jgi:DNA-directed RNA polymerase subunit M/transcription elongation factor TFIIS
MSNTVKTVKQTCTCENCGSEAEMIITCTLDEAHEHKADAPEAEDTEDKAKEQRVKGSATCTACGNEADMWIDI